MKKLIIVCIMLSLLGGLLSASESDYLTANVLITMLIPETEAKDSDKIVLAVLTLSFSGGLGVHFPVIPGIIAPGIYGDFGVSLISLLSNDDRPFFGWIGGRLYNQFSFGPIDVQPFCGLNLTGGFHHNDSWHINMKSIGLLFAINKFCVEYSYQSLIKRGFFESEGLHRLSVGYHFR